MASDDGYLDHLNDLPKRDANRDIELAAQIAFEQFVANSPDVFRQQEDRSDFGTDYQLEVRYQGQATNVRLHVQLKGTRKVEKRDGSVSIEIDRSNLNYLMMYPYSIYVCYHLPTGRLLCVSADSVARKYAHSRQEWRRQQNLTVSFFELLTHERLSSVASMARLSAFSSRDQRYLQVAAQPENLAGVISQPSPRIHVPDDRDLAAKLLPGLYEGNQEEGISAAFDTFAAVLGPNHDAMGFCYFAEINLGMNGKCNNPDRIRDGIVYLTNLIGRGVYGDAGLHYSIGNGHTALGNELEAIAEYEQALAIEPCSEDRDLRARIFKNMGSSYHKIGDNERAVQNYHLALELEPQLPEAHHALGCLYYHTGEFQKALGHFDNTVFSDGRSVKINSTAGWRINIHFNLGDVRGAFREINGLLGHAGRDAWIWPWCARQVSLFGRSSVEAAKYSLVFWDRYLKAHPGHSDGVRERLMTLLHLRINGEDVGISFDEFREEFEPIIEQVEEDSEAFLWDRLGHWAQEEDNWIEAERCYRNAYELDGGDYGYCLGTALNVLGRGRESLPILLEQAEKIQPDDVSWNEVARAYELVGDIKGCIRAYKKAIKLNDNHAPAWFNLGGIYWNNGQAVEAARIWKKAIALFPNNILAEEVRRNFGFLLG